MEKIRLILMSWKLTEGDPSNNFTARALESYRISIEQWLQKREKRANSLILLPFENHT